MQIAQPFASDRTAPAVLTIALHIVLIFGFAAGLGVIPKISVPADITVVRVPEKPVPQVVDPPFSGTGVVVKVGEIEVPKVPPVVEWDPTREQKIDDGTTVDVGPRIIPDPPISAPHLLKSFDPPYPNFSILKEEQGVVQVRVTISPRGEVGEARIEKSSGYPRLDDAALKAVRQWMFAPAMRGDQAIAGSTVIAVRFRLRT